MIKKCTICGKDFEACNVCNNTVSESFQWRRVVCCPEHFLFHEPIIQYVRGNISKEEASKALKKAIKEYGEVEFVENIAPIANELLAVDKLEEVKADIELVEKKEPTKPRSSRRIKYDKNDK